MKLHALRHIASVTLLAVYLPMVVLSSAHVHHETRDEHESCRQCVGHIEPRHHHEHDCPYCTFIGEEYLGQPSEQSKNILPFAGEIPPSIEGSSEGCCHGVAMLRAPPTA